MKPSKFQKKRFGEELRLQIKIPPGKEKRHGE
jgi:hypothetical protein